MKTRKRKVRLQTSEGVPVLTCRTTLDKELVARVVVNQHFRRPNSFQNANINN